jgi:flagellar motor switch protein FliN/FliY
MSSSQSSSSSSDAGALEPPFAGLLDVVCRVEIILGTGRLTVREYLGLGRQSVVALVQAAGEDLRLVVNGVTLARGEVLVGDQSTAVRLTQIAPAMGAVGES